MACVIPPPSTSTVRKRTLRTSKGATTMSADVIVVGGGTAGAPLAARLSEDPSRSVLLLEAGADVSKQAAFPSDLRDLRSMAGAMLGHPHNWSFVGNLTPQLPYTVPRGRILGGTSSINGVYFIRPRRIDMDGWAAAGNSAWSADKILPVLQRMETDEMFGDNASMHGADGPIPVYRETKSPSLYARTFCDACAAVGFNEEPDLNDIDQLTGYGLMPRNSQHGRRMNTALTYLNPVRDSRANLKILGNTFVHRVLFKGNRAVGVVAEHQGRVTEFYAGEVILSAGAIKTPHILLLSGIGASRDLHQHGIPTFVELPSVGKDFTDHVMSSLPWAPNQRMIEEDVNVRQLFEVALNWTAHGSHTQSDLEIFPMLRSLSASLNGPIRSGMKHPFRALKSVRGVSLKRLYKHVAGGSNLSFSVILNRPDSLGNISLRNSNPYVQPKIDYNYLSAPRDLERMREAMRTGVKLLQTKPFAPYVKRLPLSEKMLENDDALDQWMKNSLSLAIHLTGSAKMGSSDDPASVVDQYGRVHGIHGLRVADLSILPITPSRAPAVTATMIGERISDFVTGREAQ
ncbi:hypothetical protein LTS17_001923 [Exophiala oligosperma]